MAKNKRKNYLVKIPEIPPSLRWIKNSDGLVTIEIDNKGVFNRIAQKLFKKPPVSYIHLDKFGSFVFESIDGNRDIIKIGELVASHFGDEAEPLYHRLAQFFNILESYGFCSFK